MFLFIGISALLVQAILLYIPFKIKRFAPNAPSFFHGFLFRYFLLISLQIFYYKFLVLSGLINFLQEIILVKYI